MNTFIATQVRTTAYFHARQPLAQKIGQFDLVPAKTTALVVRETVEVMVGIDPQVLMRRCVGSIRNPALRNFVGTVMAERDVNRVLTMLPGESLRYTRWPIDRVRSAAESVALHASLMPAQREVLFVACLLAGIAVLIEPCVAYPSNTDDVMRSIVREALHRLDRESPSRATALRNGMGWGNDDEMDGEALEGIQQAVRMVASQLRRSLV